jgi:hypothetical protein
MRRRFREALLSPREGHFKFYREARIAIVDSDDECKRAQPGDGPLPVLSLSSRRFAQEFCIRHLLTGGECYTEVLHCQKAALLEPFEFEGFF